MSHCLACLLEDAPNPPHAPYHPHCLLPLFGHPSLPEITFGRADIPDVAERSVGKLSISGVQPKGQAIVSRDGKKLLLTEAGGRFIVKPDVQRYPDLPANEHLTMALARLVGLDVPPHALVALNDGSMAYVVRRFDRINGDPPTKRRQEDLCALTGIRSASKYDGSAEACAKLIVRHTAAPQASLRVFFMQLLFSYLIGNGDLHLKNISLLEQNDGSFALSPVYDLVCTWIYGDRALALPLQGKKTKVTRRNFLDFAEKHAQVPRDQASELLDSMIQKLQSALSLVGASPMAAEPLKGKYLALVDERMRSLSRAGTPHP